MPLITEPQKNIQRLINLRQSLHQNPELSGNEEYTAEALKRVIIRFEPDDIIDNLGGYGVAFVFRGKTSGPTIMFRGDMDALPIAESNTFDYASRTSGVSHQCGHDGHMVILVGLAEMISKNRPTSGRTVLLFQPAEEIGEGAIAVLTDPNFSRITPDYCFSLHNIPGYPSGQILIKPNTFTAASQGLVVKLQGKTSHAAEPEKGLSPAIALSQIIEKIAAIGHKEQIFKDFILATVVHACLGERNFGNTPGDAEIYITLRAYNDLDMDKLNVITQQMIRKVSEEQKLTVKIKQRDIYPVTINDVALTSLVSDLAIKAKLETDILSEPFHWAEDFSQFSQQYKSFMFGLGAGTEQPKLHNADYDFPDEIIVPGIKMFYEIYTHYCL